MSNYIRHTKSVTFVDLKSFLALTLIVLAFTLSACSEKSSQNEVTVSDETLSAPLPSTLLTVDETNLVVEVVVDGGSPQTCTNLSVDQGNGTYSCNINLPSGQHTVSLIYSIIDTTYGTVRVANTSGVTVNVSSGLTTSVDFSTVPLTYDDNDNDGINNLDELNEGSDPNESNYSVIYVSTDATNANYSNAGARDQPLKTITAAVNLANSTLSKSEIRVALGSYTTFSEGGTNIIEVSDGMRLMGGYSADWLLRNTNTYPTIINDTSTTTASDANNPNCVITISAGAGSETLVDGFTLTGGGITDGSGSGASCGIEIEMNASPTIENNIISGGRAASSTGIIDRGLSPVIRNNTIRGNEPGADSNAITGIRSDGSSPIITGNDINGGSGIAGRSGGTGISLTDVNAIVEQNSVVGGNAEVSTGVSIAGVSTVSLRNNTIHGGNSFNTEGVSIGAGNTITLQNNTIFSGNSTFEVALSIGSPAIIENNTFFGSMCIEETDNNADPISLSANNLYGCEQRFFYRDKDAQCTGNADGDTDATTCTLAEMNLLTDTQVIANNINVDLGFGTQPNADWHLNTASPTAVKFGGINLSVDFSTDKDGTQRTTPWSIGAYEKD